MANEAVTAVSFLFAKAGAIGEQIRNDYGEDLFLLSNLRDHVDAFRIWVQVKGAKLSKNSKDEYTHRFEVRHLIRWISQFDPTIICIYDSNSGKIFQLQPHIKFTMWQLYTTKRKTVTTTFRDDDELTVDSAMRFIWQCRTIYFSKDARSVRGLVFRPTQGKNQKNGDNVLIVFDFLRSVGAVGTDRIPDEILVRVRNFLRNHRTSEDRAIKELGIEMGFTLALLAHAQDAGTPGLPGNLLDRGTEMLGHFASVWHPDMWAEYRALCPGSRWRPVSVRRSKRVQGPRTRH